MDNITQLLMLIALVALVVIVIILLFLYPLCSAITWSIVIAKILYKKR